MSYNHDVCNHDAHRHIHILRCVISVIYVTAINFTAHLLWCCGKHKWISVYFFFNLSAVWTLVWRGMSQEIETAKIWHLFFSLFYKAGCSVYLWSSTWDKDSAISVQLTEDYFPKAKACISLTVLSTDFQQYILTIIRVCSQNLTWHIQYMNGYVLHSKILKHQSTRNDGISTPWHLTAHWYLLLHWLLH